MANKWLKLFPDATRNKIEYYIDGTKAFASIVNAIKTAKSQEHYIYILGWMLDIDFPLIETDQKSTLINLLNTASSSGVELRILIWNNPSLEIQRMNLNNIPRLNGLSNTFALLDDNTYSTAESQQFVAKFVPFIMQKFNQYTSIFKELDPLYALLRYCITKNVGSHHEKVIVIKGEEGLIAFCGGMDINKNRFDAYHKDYSNVHDVHCKVQGPAAYQILQKFKKRWHNHPSTKNVLLKGENETKPAEITFGDFQYGKVVGTYNDPNSNDRDRSLNDAYFSIIANAKNYIYIEDQYLVNVDVAKQLNKKIQESTFIRLILAIQDSQETTDILIPDRKRGEFWDALLDGTDKQVKDKVALVLIDRVNAPKENYHPAMHSKIIIVDDEIAIIGSANVNQRSFTHDSETSIVIFDETSLMQDSFAKKMRLEIWKEFSSKTISPDSIVASWEQFSRILMNPTVHPLMLIPYINSIEDLDKRIIDYIKKSGAIAPIVANILVGDNSNLSVALANVSTVLSPFQIVQIFNGLWDNVIDPQVK
ncbi:phospholipase D-like domain-containing protein [Fluoribacter gormanii]|uniref:Cardiolipin synthase n=1 Tax=Fluoribacter gormanii TaxID=464 RepID=A0A377GN21_9GAMM|nr:phosphatidylserine/phosphatidylglycerophosphate/cardiolipin synthase family protein [Fluoribacter gormanii]KTD04801.1 Cardiolipin synthase [Fluoribacter gormanii]SIR17658.1 Phosphatidylserine/phosphatidylglycerophosphate/cardiolipin synthase [Fluoribacter gormanii]STO26196.1 Cardiolipin synthase [Fluoribacter gormanii]